MIGPVLAGAPMKVFRQPARQQPEEWERANSYQHWLCRGDADHGGDRGPRRALVVQFTGAASCIAWPLGKQIPLGWLGADAPGDGRRALAFGGPKARWSEPVFWRDDFSVWRRSVGFSPTRARRCPRDVCPVRRSVADGQSLCAGSRADACSVLLGGGANELPQRTPLHGSSPGLRLRSR